MAVTSVRTASRCATEKGTRGRSAVLTGPSSQALLDYSTCLGPARAAVAHVAARFGLSPADAEDLHGDLWVRILANQGRALTRFRRGARIDTYLATIATNLLIDRSRRVCGKWRPSARSLRNGAGAVELERLIARDGLSRDSAIELVTKRWPDTERAPLERFAESMVQRPPRSAVPSDELENRASPDRSPFQELSSTELDRSAASLASALNQALASLSAADRLAMTWRYVDRRTVADIAGTLQVDQKALYRHFDRLCGHVKKRIEASGFKAAEVSELLANGSSFDDSGLSPARASSPSRCEVLPFRKSDRLERTIRRFGALELSAIPNSSDVTSDVSVSDC